MKNKDQKFMAIGILVLIILAGGFYYMSSSYFKLSVVDDCSRISEIKNKVNYQIDTTVNIGNINGGSSAISQLGDEGTALLIQNIPTYAELTESKVIIKIESVSNSNNQMHIGKSLTLNAISGKCGNNIVLMYYGSPQADFLNNGISNPEGQYSITYKALFTETTSTIPVNTYNYSQPSNDQIIDLIQNETSEIITPYVPVTNLSNDNNEVNNIINKPTYKVDNKILLIVIILFGVLIYVLYRKYY